MLNVQSTPKWSIHMLHYSLRGDSSEPFSEFAIESEGI